MPNTTTKTNAPAFLHNETAIQVEYSFSEYTDIPLWTSSNKIWLDILFVHPENDEVASVRVVKSNLILCQPKEVIEAIVHREVRSFLSLPYSSYGYL
jgi:hypothetical protein